MASKTSVQASDTVSYTITLLVTNGPASSVVVQDSLPAPTTFQSFIPNRRNHYISKRFAFDLDPPGLLNYIYQLPLEIRNWIMLVGDHQHKLDHIPMFNCLFGLLDDI